MANTMHNHLASYTKDAIAWQCNICDSAVDVTQKFEHLALPQHRHRAVTHQFVSLAPDLTGQYIYETSDRSEHVAGRVIRNQATVRVADVDDAGGGGEDSDSNSDCNSEDADGDEEDQDEESDSEEEDAMHPTAQPLSLVGEQHTARVSAAAAANSGSHTWTPGGFNATDPRSFLARNQPPPQLTRYTWVLTNPGGGPARMSVGPLPVRPDYCYICPRALDSEQLSSHLMWHSTNPISNNGPPPRLPPFQPAVTWKYTGKPRYNTGKPMYNTGKPKHKKGRKAKKQKEKSLYCNVCKKHKKATGMADHNNGLKHNQNLAAQGLTQAANTIGSTANIAVSTTKLPAVALQRLPLDILAASQPFITITDDKFHCNLCSRDRAVAGISSHVKSYNHKMNLAAALWSPTPNAASAEAARTPSQAPDMEPLVPEPLTQEGYIYCDVCRTNTAVPELAAHMASQQHHENSTETVV